MSLDPARGRRLGVGAFLLMAGVIAWRYVPVDPPEGLFLLGALLLWISVFGLAAVGLGLPLWRAISRCKTPNADDWTIATAFGIGALASAAGLLGALGALHRVTLLSILLLAAVAGARAIVRQGTFAPSVANWPLSATVLLAISGGITLLATASPSPFYDQFHYHLAFPDQWLRSGSIDVFPRHAYSYLAANMGLLYLYALAGPGIWGAQALHWCMGLLSCVAVFRVARRLGAGPTGAAWSAALLATTPSVLLSSTWAASDLGVTAFGLVALLALLAVPAGATGPRAWAQHAGVGALCGFAFGCKYLALATVAIPVALMVCGLTLTGGRRLAPRAAFAAVLAWGLGLSAVAAPWLLRNAWLTGDPVYPFLGRLLGRGEAQSAARGISGAADSALASVLTLGTFDPQGAAGRIGPLWLALLLLWFGALIFGRRERRSLVLAAAVISGLVAWSQVHQLARYLVPVLALAACALGVLVERTLFDSTVALRRASVALLTVGMLWGIQGGLSSALFTRMACTFSRSDPHDLLSRYVTYWPALELVNQGLPADAKLLLLGEPRSLYLEREVVVEDPFRKPWLVELAESRESPDAMARELRAAGVTHVLYNRQEAARIARMTHRERYLLTASATEAVRLTAFLTSCLDLVGEAAPVQVFALSQRCENQGAQPAVR